MQREARKRFEERLAENVKVNPRAYYAYAQANKKVREGVGNLETDTGATVDDDKSKADLLMKTFRRVFRQTTSASSVEAVDGGERCRMAEFLTTENEVGQILRTLNRHKAAGVDGIHPAIVCLIADIICTEVTKLFNSSLMSG